MTLFPRLTAVSLLALAATTHPAAQDVVVDPGPLVAARQLHDAGKYREAIDAIGAEQAKRTLWARLLYLEAQSYERISERENAARLYRELGGLDGPSWQSIGQSALEQSAYSASEWPRRSKPRLRATSLWRCSISAS